MITNPSRRAFIKKSLVLASSIPLYGCGGGSSTTPNAIAVAPPATTPPPAAVPALAAFLIQPSDQTVNPGDNATFQALADGVEPLTYQWQRSSINITGATSLSYTTPPAALGDDALFSVLVTNDAGTISSREAQFTVTAAPLAAPAINTQPTDQLSIEGGQAIFQVLSDGSPPLSYQWLRNGQPISGATSSSYTTPALALGDNAGFSVTITNDAGTITSLTAQLDVLANRVTVDSITETVDSTLLTVDSV